MRLQEFFQKHARARGILMAEKLAKEVRRLLSVPAPVRRTAGGRLVATVRATPGAPPRAITYTLYNSVSVQRTTNGAKIAVYLERGGHPFFSVALADLGLKGRNS